jgi:hypothetical protein
LTMRPRFDWALSKELAVDSAGMEAAADNRGRQGLTLSSFKKCGEPGAQATRSLTP